MTKETPKRKPGRPKGSKNKPRMQEGGTIKARFNEIAESYEEVEYQRFCGHLDRWNKENCSWVYKSELYTKVPSYIKTPSLLSRMLNKFWPAK